MKLPNRIGVPLLACALSLPALPLYTLAQESKPTVRHHRVEEPVPEDPNARQIDQAETAMQQKDFASAEALLQKVIVADPNNYRAWFDLGYVYNATRRLPDATDAYRKSVAAKPDVFESNLNLGILLARQGNNPEAATYLRAATQLKPTAHPEEGRARAWQSLGRVLESSDPQQALAAYEEAAKLMPSDPEPHLSAAILLEKQNNLQEALHEYKTAADLDPKSPEALAGLVNIYTRQKNYAAAETMLRKLLQANPADNNARIQLGRVLAEEGKFDQAAQELQAGSQAAPGDPHVALELGSLYVKAGKDADAEQQLRLAVQGLPQNAEAHYALGSLLMHIKKYPEAEQELITSLKLNPDVGQAWGNLAVVAAENKHYELTLKALDARARYLPEIPATYFLRATSYDNLKAKAQAVEYYQQFLQASAGAMPDQEWQARHRLVALDPRNSDKYVQKK
jgi:Flp pilus assembly protein TadD